MKIERLHNFVFAPNFVNMSKPLHTSFAIDSSQWVMTPVDTSVTFTGNSVLSALDIAKMECLYYCDGTNPGTCGGHKQGMEIDF